MKEGEIVVHGAHDTSMVAVQSSNITQEIYVASQETGSIRLNGVPNTLRIRRPNHFILVCIEHLYNFHIVTLLYPPDHLPLDPQEHPHPPSHELSDLKPEYGCAAIWVRVQVTRQFDRPRQSEDKVEKGEEWIDGEREQEKGPESPWVRSPLMSWIVQLVRGRVSARRRTTTRVVV